jgi:hypothetical protein
MATEPQLKAGKWTLDADPDDELWYVGDMTKWLTDNATTTASFELVPVGVEVLAKGDPQGDRGALLPAKLKMAPLPGTPPFCTFRVLTADGQRFDKTMYFNLVQN